MRHNISLRQIEGFLLASEMLSFTRAAEAMNISQSSFSQLIRELEGNLGVRLFDRTTRRIVMTFAGEAMYRKMSKVTEAIDDACEEAQAIARIERGHLTFGSVSSLAIGIVARTLGNLRKKYPGITATFQEGLNEDLVARVAKGELDFAVCAQSADATGLSFNAIYEEEMVLVLPRSDRRAGREKIQWADLDGENFVTGVRRSSVYHLISDIMASQNVQLGQEYEAASLFTQLSLVRSGFGFAFISELVKSDVNMEGLTTVKIQDPPARRSGIYRLAERSPSPAAITFQSLLKLEFAQTAKRYNLTHK